MTTNGFVTERWVYGGKRLNGRGTASPYLVDQWYDETGESIGIWKKHPGQLVGGIYEVQVKREGESANSVRGEPVWTGDTFADEARVAGWEARSGQARSDLRRHQAEKRQAKNTELERALAPLVALAGRMRNYEDMEALRAMVSRRIVQSWHQG